MTKENQSNWDAIITGGGLIGLSIGYGLSIRGFSVLILDEGDLDIRAARGNFGLVWVQGKGAYFPSYADWTMRSATLWPQFADSLSSFGGPSIGLNQSGGLAVCLSDEEMQQRNDKLKNLRSNQNGRFEFQMLDRRELEDLMPGIGPKVVGAAYCPHDGHVNPLYLMRALAKGLIENGGLILTKNPLTDVKKIGDNIIVITPKRRFECQRLVLAAGLANAKLAPKIGLKQSIQPQKGQIIITEKLDQKFALPTLLMRQTEEGGIMIGDSHEDTGFETGVCPKITSGIADRAIATFPKIAESNVIRSWAALRVMSRDGYPIYNQSKLMEGAFAISCHSGVTLAAAHAIDLAGYIAETKLGAELEAFSEERFDVQKT